MSRDQERHRYSLDGIQPREMPRLGYADRLRKLAAEEGSRRLLMAYRRYFMRHHSNIGALIAYQEARKARAARRKKPASPRMWKPEEDRLALELTAAGKTPGQISFKIDRTPDAISARLRLLRLKGEARS